MSGADEPPQRYGVGDRVTLRNYPSVGSVQEVRPYRSVGFHSSAGRVVLWLYRVNWPQFPEDPRWYQQDELVEAP